MNEIDNMGPTLILNYNKIVTISLPIEKLKQFSERDFNNCYANCYMYVWDLDFNSTSIYLDIYLADVKARPVVFHYVVKRRCKTT